MNIGMTELYLLCLGLPAIILPVVSLVLLVMVYLKVKKIEEIIQQRNA